MEPLLRGGGQEQQQGPDFDAPLENNRVLDELVAAFLAGRGMAQEGPKDPRQLLVWRGEGAHDEL